MKTKISSGFTLVELLVVVSLIGILTTLVVANLNSARERARDASRKSDLRNIQTGLRLYYNDIGQFPLSSSGDVVACDGTCTWGEAWINDSITYMNTLPSDPLSDQSYVYTYVDDDSYTLKSCLENASDDKGEVEVDSDWCVSEWKYEVSP
ncbi:prepilin-type N-terminal cleavage/methylation domain-containing protein [Candidatus Microgenomates bacterium]|nr:prepilin-type N-terminal cleavage/methylation domain-containing protein [Candidatus Microgenomates bacterium]